MHPLPSPVLDPLEAGAAFRLLLAECPLLTGHLWVPASEWDLIGFPKAGKGEREGKTQN